MQHMLCKKGTQNKQALKKILYIIQLWEIFESSVWKGKTKKIVK